MGESGKGLRKRKESEEQKDNFLRAELWKKGAVVVVVLEEICTKCPHPGSNTAVGQFAQALLGKGNKKMKSRA